MPEGKLFGTDGVRGEANRYPVTPEIAVRLGRAIAGVLRKTARGEETERGNPACVIGRDTRASCDMLASALASGFNSAGVNVIDAGVVPTPAVAFLARDLGAMAGAMISASHNPHTDNGIKFFTGDGYKLAVEVESEVESLALSLDESTFLGPTGGQIGRCRELAGGALRYVDFAIRSAEGTRLEGIKVALDNANGASSFTSTAILEKLGADVSVFHSEPDGININDNCGCTHPHTIQKLVADTGAQVGLAHDGDADRIMLVDEKGGLCDGDDILAIAAAHYIPQGKLAGDTVVATIMSNYGLDALLGELGGAVVRTGVGDRAVITSMRQNGYNVGGESSGHLIFSDHNSTGDGIISAVQILKIMVETGKPLSELRSVLKKYPQVLRNITVASKPPAETLTDAQKLLGETESELAGKGRVLLRYSGTEPKIRLLIEGPDVGYMERQADRIAEAIVSQIG